MKRIKAQRFEMWWESQKAEWGDELEEIARLCRFDTSHRMARIYRAVRIRYEKNLHRGSGFQPYHATHLHSQYRLKRRSWK